LKNGGERKFTNKAAQAMHLPSDTLVCKWLGRVLSP